MSCKTSIGSAGRRSFLGEVLDLLCVCPAGETGTVLDSGAGELPSSGKGRNKGGEE
jgi:hypothetical protein